MLDDLMKKGSLPQGVKIENIEEVQKMLENTRAKKLSALSAKELKTLLAGTNDKFHDYGRAREVLLPDDPKLFLQILLQGHPKIRKLLSEITNDFSPDACKKIRTDVEQSISSLFDHPIYGPLVNLMLYLDETLAKDESIDDDSGTITVSQTSIQVRTLLAELLLPELKNHTFPGYSTLQELIADAHDEPTNAQTARILFGAGLINSQVTTLMRLGICGKVRADDIS